MRLKRIKKEPDLNTAIFSYYSIGADKCLANYNSKYELFYVVELFFRHLKELY